jgi:hypothetical protein
MAALPTLLRVTAVLWIASAFVSFLKGNNLNDPEKLAIRLLEAGLISFGVAIGVTILLQIMIRLLSIMNKR